MPPLLLGVLSSLEMAISTADELGIVSAYLFRTPTDRRALVHLCLRRRRTGGGTPRFRRPEQSDLSVTAPALLKMPIDNESLFFVVSTFFNLAGKEV